MSVQRPRRSLARNDAKMQAQTAHVCSSSETDSHASSVTDGQLLVLSRCQGTKSEEVTRVSQTLQNSHLGAVNS